jgi:hypothetical protein
MSVNSRPCAITEGEFLSRIGGRTDSNLTDTPLLKSAIKVFALSFWPSVILYSTDSMISCSLCMSIGVEVRWGGAGLENGSKNRREGETGMTQVQEFPDTSVD